MDIISKKVEGNLISFTSINEKIKVNITQDSNGPVFMLSDGSVIRFYDMSQYYNIMTNEDLYDVNTQSLNLDNLQEYFIDSDEVNRYNIDEVEKYRVDSKELYRFILQEK